MCRTALSGVFLLWVVVARSQVIELHGGDSSLFNAAGGGATLYFPKSTMDVNVALEGGHIVEGFSDQRQWRNFTLTLGDHAFGATIGGTGVGFVVRGLTLERSDSKMDLAAFIGTTAWAYDTPFFYSARSRNLGAGFFFRRQVAKRWEIASLAILEGSKLTALQEVGYRGTWLKFTGAGGLREGSRFWSAHADFKPVRFANASLVHQTYFMNGEPVPVDEAGGALLAGRMDFHGALFSANHVNGETAGAGARAGPFDARLDYYRSRFGRILTGQLTERVGQRLRLSQFASNSAGHWQVSYGCGWSGNLISASIGYQTLFVPLFGRRRPFEQAINLQLSLQLPQSVTFHGETNVAPDGSLRFSTYGSAFAEGPLAGSEDHKRGSLGGKYLIKGVAVDRAGAPIEGAAILIGKQTVCTDTYGGFFLRQQRARTLRLSVSLEEFLAPGSWRVVASPESVRAVPESMAVPVSIVLEH